MVKNCDRGLENAARGRMFKSVTVSVTSTVTVVRDRKIQTELRTNQIVGFVPAWKKIMYFILFYLLQLRLTISERALYRAYMS